MYILKCITNLNNTYNLSEKFENKRIFLRVIKLADSRKAQVSKVLSVIFIPEAAQRKV